MNFLQETSVKLIAKFGKVKQLFKCVEELAELAAIITKLAFKENLTVEDKAAVLSEVADVIFCLEHIKNIFALPPSQINDALTFKVNRARGLVEVAAQVNYEVKTASDIIKDLPKDLFTDKDRLLNFIKTEYKDWLDRKLKNITEVAK